MRGRSSGFTLVELVVAIGLLAIVFIGVLNMLDTSTTVSKVESAVADTQENVRFAAYHIVRTVRMTGGGEMPFAIDDGRWVCGQVQNNQSGNVATDLGVNVQVAAGTDVVTLRGFFEVAPFFTDRIDVDTSAGTVTVRERQILGDASSPIINPLGNVPTANAFVGRGIVFMGRRRYAVGEVTGSAVGGADPSRTLTLNYDGGSGLWETFNLDGVALAGGDPPFNVYRVGILNTYTYFVAPDWTLMRLRADAGGTQLEPVAVNIGSLQVVIGLDNDGDGNVDTWDSTPTAAEAAAGTVAAMRITVLGRTPFEVREWREPAATFAIADDALDAGLFNRGAKWRRMDVTASLRNFSM